MKTLVYVFAATIFFSCNKEAPQANHVGLTHNFTIKRLIVINDKNEVLMSSEKEVWATPFLLHSKRQFIKEALDSVSAAYGIKTTVPQLHGQFSFKYDYHPYATIRNYYVAHYISGEIKIPEGLDKVQWVPLPEAIDKNSVTAIKEITAQIIKYPNIVWGASFLVSHVGDDHPTKMVEPFYPLFKPKSKN